MTVERIDAEHEEVRAFFERPGETVASELSTRWLRHQNRQEVLNGQSRILGLDTPVGVRYFRVEEVVYYDDQYTKKRWPRSRAPEIASMNPGEVIGYAFHQSVLTFIKVDSLGSSANIQLSNIREIDAFGSPISRRDALLSAGKVAELFGLAHQSMAHLTPFNFRNNRALMLSVGSRELTPEEIKRIEDEILNF